MNTVKTNVLPMPNANDRLKIIDEHIDADEKSVVDSSESAIRNRWEFGKALLAERVGKQLPKGRFEEVVSLTGKSGTEIKYRVQFAEYFPTETELADVISRFRSWDRIKNEALPKAVSAQPSSQPVKSTGSFKVATTGATSSHRRKPRQPRTAKAKATSRAALILPRKPTPPPKPLIPPEKSKAEVIAGVHKLADGKSHTLAEVYQAFGLGPAGKKRQWLVDRAKDLRWLGIEISKTPRGAEYTYRVHKLCELRSEIDTIFPELNFLPVAEFLDNLAVEITSFEQKLLAQKNPEWHHADGLTVDRARTLNMIQDELDKIPLDKLTKTPIPNRGQSMHGYVTSLRTEITRRRKENHDQRIHNNYIIKNVNTREQINLLDWIKTELKAAPKVTIA